jgi:hypothetical protein
MLFVLCNPDNGGLETLWLLLPLKSAFVYMSSSCFVPARSAHVEEPGTLSNLQAMAGPSDQSGHGAPWLAERRALAEQKSNLSSADQNPHLRTDGPSKTQKQPLSQKQEGDLAHTLQTLSLGAGPGVSATSAKKAFISGSNGYGTKPFEAPVPTNAQEQAERSVSQSSSSPTQARQASRASYTSSSRQKSPPSISCR